MRLRSLLLGSSLLFAGCGSLSAPNVSPEGGTKAVPRFEHYLRSDTYQRLTLELDAVSGMAPREISANGVVSALTPLLDKPAGINVALDETLESRGADHVWTIAELDALAREKFDLEVPEDTVKMHVLFVDGSYEKDTDSGEVLGVAWAHQNVVIFKQTIEKLCRSGLGSLMAEQVCQKTEQGVWIHELGHVLGLVDNGLAMQVSHVDPEHPGHDHNQDCVMYWAWEGGGVIDSIRTAIIGGEDPKMSFDAACLNDLAAVRER